MRMKHILSGTAILVCISSCTSYSEVNTRRNTGAKWVDVHGAGSQRSDPKSGDASLYAEGRGPQGDSIRINNMVRPVRSFSNSDMPYTIVDTNQTTRFDNADATTNKAVFVGQDADYLNLAPSYSNNGDGTVTDNITGLMWQQNPGKKMNWYEANRLVKTMNLAGYDDWRIPTIKELYSLIKFSGRDLSPQSLSGGIPFIDTDNFDFSYGDTSGGERLIDSQYMSSTKYVTTTMHGNETVFGVNFADGRIKGYGMKRRGRNKEFYVIFVRGDREYGENNFLDNGDGTVSDLATGLMWLQEDAGPMNWGDALEYCESLSVAGYDDWRLPDVKELQSLVDYSRSPATTNSAAIDPVFECSALKNEAGEDDYGYYWSSTTHAVSRNRNSGSAAAYVAFGRSMGNMSNLEMIGLSPNGRQRSEKPPFPPGQ